MVVALKVAAVRSRAARPAAGDPVAGAAACPVDPRVAAARAAAVGQFRAARRVLAVLVAEAAAFLGAVRRRRSRRRWRLCARRGVRLGSLIRGGCQRSPGTRAALPYRDLRESASLYVTSAADE